MGLLFVLAVIVIAIALLPTALGVLAASLWIIVPIGLLALVAALLGVGGQAVERPTSPRPVIREIGPDRYWITCPECRRDRASGDQREAERLTVEYEPPGPVSITTLVAYATARIVDDCPRHRLGALPDAERSGISARLVNEIAIWEYERDQRRWGRRRQRARRGP